MEYNLQLLYTSKNVWCYLSRVASVFYIALDRGRHHSRSSQYEIIKIKFTVERWGRYRCGYIVSCNELSDYLSLDESGQQLLCK